MLDNPKDYWHDDEDEDDEDAEFIAVKPGEEEYIDDYDPDEDDRACF